jgi:hypothetical protein
MPDGHDPAGNRFANRRNFHFSAHEGVTLCAIEVGGRTERAFIMVGRRSAEPPISLLILRRLDRVSPYQFFLTN